MQIKIVLLVIMIVFCFTGFSQKVLDQKDSIAKNITPIESKSIVFIIRPTMYGSLIQMNVSCDSMRIGTTSAKSYLYTVLDPGKHVFISKAENKSVLEVAFEPGKIYYIEQQVKMGVIYGRTRLKLVTEEVGKKFLSKCKLSKNNTYTD